MSRTYIHVLGEDASLSDVSDALRRAGITPDYDLTFAVIRMQESLPGWWFTVGRCGLTCHASVGPDRAFIQPPLLDKYDGGFHADIPNPTTCADALDEAVRKAVATLTAQGDYPSKAPSDD